MLRFKKYRFFFLLCCITASAIAQDKSNKGKDFWLGYGHNVLFTQDPPFNTQTHVLYLSAEQAATVTVSVNGTGWSRTVNIPPNTVDFSVNIPKTGPEDARLLAEGLSTKGIHIISDVPIVAYSHQYGLFSSAATMLMPVETFGYTYYSLNYTQVSNYVDSYSWFYVVASENNTRLQITPSDSTEGGWLPSQTYTVNLNRGEIYNVFGKRTSALSSKDMTGSKIVSIAGADGTCHPVAVFSGSSRNIICAGNGGEILQQQIFPANAWGTKYLTYHTVNNAGGNINTPFLNHYRVAVRNPATVVRRNGAVLTGLVNNFYYQFSSTSGDVIEADQPILVAQYTVSSNECTGTGANPLGDPEMIYISPIEQGVKRAIFYNTRNQAISLNFVNIILPTAGISSLLIDGAPPDPTEYIPHPVNPAYSVVVKRLPGAGAQHSISSDSTFIATNYGAGITESYGYNVGTLVNNLNALSQIQNTFSTTGITDTFTCPRTPFRLFIKLAYPATSIHWKLSQVAGITPSTDSVISNPVLVATQQINGRNYYSYTLQQDFSFTNPGTYFIPVTYTSPGIDNCNQTETSSIKVVVKPGPVADFTYAAPGGCLTDSVYFTGSSVPGTFNLTNYNWLFADNSTANTVNTVKFFPAPGSQVVRYTIMADNGCWDDTVKTVITSGRPVAQFSTSGNACGRDSVRITDASVVSTGTISTWHWNFGDGNNTVRNNNAPFNYAYANPGSYTISLYNTASSGCISDTVYVPVTIFPKPVASFTNSGNLCLGDSVRITDASTLSGGTISSWQWNFGDGNSVVRNNNSPFYHTYSAAGNYSMSLVVTGSNGCRSDTFRLAVPINPKPVATFTLTGKPCTDSLFSFTSSIPPGGTNPPAWFWNFGDGQTFNSATVNTASHAYAVTGTNITVRHWVTYTGGCGSDTAFSTIPLIVANPVASFTITGSPFCERSPVSLGSTVSGISNWNWNLGNGSSAAIPPFSHSYANAGNYPVSLVVTTAAGCSSAPATQTLVIQPRPPISAGPDKMIQSGSSASLDATIGNPSNYDFLWTPSLFLNATTVLNPVSTPASQVTYTIRATDRLSGCSNTDDVVITPVSGLFVPTGFTPNRDGRNDTWNIPGLALYPGSRAMVFNRAGNLVYDSEEQGGRPWNGKYKGLDQPNGVYVYLVQVNDTAQTILKGTLALVR